MKCDLVPWSDGVKVKVKNGFTTPWRTIQIAETPGDLITSYLILNLNDPNKIEDTSWIKPHKYLRYLVGNAHW
ncbi:MAG: glycoside hydrolase family 97 N-terminal domain-containing protein [Flavobacteriaceae bacterium]|nr:glycoside hydrolase family 97 N-terminal domain-containing protein [Flavobacteriaceae bacterium]